MNSDNLTSSCIFRKLFVSALICTVIANILCLPLWTDYDVIGFILTPYNKKARIDIIYTGALTGAEAFSVTSAEPSLSAPTNYRYGKGTQLYIANLQIGEEWKTYSLTLTAHRRGWIQIRLKDPIRTNDYNEIYSIAVDYRNLKIGEKEIFNDRKKVVGGKDFSYRLPVNANDTMKISFDVCRHHFNADDFNLRKTKNFWYIITLSILALVIFHVLLQRLATSYKHRRAEDAVFMCIFSFLLVVPLGNISDAQKSVRERRALKQCPKVPLVLKGGMNYGKEYDDWFCDHLGGREWLLKLHDAVQRRTQLIIRGPRAWYIQDSGECFYTPFTTSMNTRHVKSIVSNLTELKNFCKLNRIKFYAFVVPRKESIYREKLYGYGFDDKRSAAENAVHKQIEHLARRQHIAYIYPWMELRDASKRERTFFRESHHWTDWGAYIGYCVLMKGIRRDFPDMPVIPLKDYKLTRSRLVRDVYYREFGFGDFKKYFNFETEERRFATMYNYYDHKNADKLLLNIGEFTKEFRYGGGYTKSW